MCVFITLRSHSFYNLFIFARMQGLTKLLSSLNTETIIEEEVFVCVEVLWPSQPNGVMSSAVNLPNHTFTGQA